MTTGVRGRAARNLGLQAVHYFRKTVNYNDTGISSGVSVGFLPAGAQIVGTVVNVETAFNAATTNVLTVGTNSSSYDNIAAGADVTEGSAAGSGLITAGTGLEFTQDTELFVKYTQTGTAASAGKAHVIVMFVPNNDQ